MGQVSGEPRTPSKDEQARFRILGPLEAIIEGHPVPLPATKHRILLAALLVRANRVVPTVQLIDFVWPGSPPAGARGAIHTYLARLRSALRPAEIITRQRDGYVIELPPTSLDLHHFRRLVTEATNVGSGGLVAESALLRQALDLWRGPALSDIPSDPLRALALTLDEDRLRVLERCIDIDLELRRYRDLVPELRGLVAEHGMRERFWEQLMLALHGSGRTAEALEAYRAVRALFTDELGMEPGEQLQRLHQRVLAGEAPNASTGVRLPATLAATGPETATSWPMPCTLPPDVRTYVGRSTEMKQVKTWLGSGGPAHPPIVAVCGPPGTGKTALAVRAAHQLRQAYPDGQLYVRLSDADGAPRDTAEVLAELLHVTGMDPTRLPEGRHARAAWLRGRLADRSVLLVLDDAADAAQIRPLLPGTAGAAVIVTSRRDLRGLIALEDAYMVTLDILPSGDAVKLLRALLTHGPEVEPDTLAEVAKLCGYLPLALRLAAANLAGRSPDEVTRYLAGLRSTDRLSHLAVSGDEEAAVRATFELSYRALTPPARRLFRLLGLVPGPGFTAETAAALIGYSLPRTQDLLKTMDGLHLVTPRETRRYQFHDLLRVYAIERATMDDPPSTRHDALIRLLDHQLAAVDRAATLLYPDLSRLPRPSGTVTARPFESATDARRYLDEERANLVATIEYCANSGADVARYAWHLADALRGYFHSHSTTTQWRAATDAGMSAALQAGDCAAQAAMHMSHGLLHWTLGRHQEALTSLTSALHASRTAGLATMEGAALSNLGLVHLQAGTPQQAIRRFRRALELAHTTDQPFLASNTLVNLASAYLDTGDPVTAQRCSEEARDICERIGSPHTAAIARSNLGQACQALGLLDEAAAHLTEALSAFEELGAVADQAETAGHLALLERHRGNQEAALGWATRALALARSTRVPRLIDAVVGVIASVRGSAEGVQAASTLRLKLGR